MAKLTPNATASVLGVTINEKIIPDGTVWTNATNAQKAGFSKGSLYKAQKKLSGTGKPKSVTIHNTNDLDNVYDDGEQYTRATYNQNMNSSRVHFYVDDTGAWQNLRAGTGLFAADPVGNAEVSWHSGDGSVADGGNMTSLSIEIIMAESTETDKKAYDNGARLAAWLLHHHGLTINDLVTHTYWVNKTAGKSFADKDTQCTNPISEKKWCPTYIFNSNNAATAKKNWLAFKAVVKGYLDELNGAATPAPTPAPSAPDTAGLTSIMGASVATEAQMRAYADKIGMPGSVHALVPLYLYEGKEEGVRGDIAFAQSCLETGNFGFAGSAVTMDQNNFCGMGVTSNGVKGNSFATPSEGVRAQIQHLKAYASTDALKNAVIDPRYKYVTRGCAPYVEWLGQKENPDGKGWAAGAGYGEKILKILKAILVTDVGAAPVTPPAGSNTAQDAGGLYRVRKVWTDAKSQLGAYANLDNAKAMADKNPGYYVFDKTGHKVYPTGDTAPADTSFMVQTKVSLNVRQSPDKSSKALSTAAPGVYTILEVQPGNGSTAGWGRLKSGAGWISMDYATRL